MKHFWLFQLAPGLSFKNPGGRSDVKEQVIRVGQNDFHFYMYLNMNGLIYRHPGNEL